MAGFPVTEPAGSGETALACLARTRVPVVPLGFRVPVACTSGVGRFGAVELPLFVAP
ncbi:hypothetical protein PJL18_00655 [Paenarthrobacter nicotinovorans]|nr:hypothetical protein [Paenarthrobacter nicotinovorans]